MTGLFVLFLCILFCIPGCKKRIRTWRILYGKKQTFRGTVVSKRRETGGRVSPSELWQRKEIIGFPYFERGFLGKTPKYTFFYGTLRGMDGVEREYQLPYDLYEHLQVSEFVTLSVREDVVRGAEDFRGIKAWKKARRKAVAWRAAVVLVLMALWALLTFGGESLDREMEQDVTVSTSEVSAEESETLLTQLGLPAGFCGEVVSVTYQEKGSAFGTRIDVEFSLEEADTERFIQELGRGYFEVETPYEQAYGGFAGEEHFPSSFAKAEDRLFFYGEENPALYSAIPAFDQILLEEPEGGKVRVLAVFGMPTDAAKEIAKGIALTKQNPLLRKISSFP